ncbi:thiolase family protein [Patescibacteria group bacterium]|nr:thiolase family protein [Patescibacteria group bacterium]
MDRKPVVIVGAARTPIGAFQGGLSTMTAPQLGAVAIKAALERAGVPADRVDEVIMGNVLSAGVGQAPARQAAIAAGIPASAHAMTINKVCASGLMAVELGMQRIQLGVSDIVVAGGMESMSQVPYYLPVARTGFRLGHQQAVDGIIHDGLWDPYGDKHMGSYAELCATEHNLSREAQDAFAATSYSKALSAIEAGRFHDEIVPVSIPQRKGDPVIVDTDEEPGMGRPDKLPKLRPAFQKEGTVTAGNASSINDGAAAVVLMSASMAAMMGLTPLGYIVDSVTASREPEWFTIAPADAIDALLRKTGKNIDGVNLFEINEAFSAVAMANNLLLGLDTYKVNIWGGAVALGHPIGASGCRILVTLLYALKHGNMNCGIASLCNGGGEAVAMMVERS